MKRETICLHAGYTPENGAPQVVPICQSTTYRYRSTDEVASLFDLTSNGFFYSRIGNPTVAAVEEKIAILEGGVGALCTSSGQAATFLGILNIAKAGDHIVSVNNIYGGSVNLFNVTFKRFGIDVTFIDGDATPQEINDAIKPNTKLVFGETIANPTVSVFDIEKFAKVAHQNQIPLMVDNTFATPILCRPIEFGADIVTHSTTKYMDGHAETMGGVIVDSGNFDWTQGKFAELCEPDESYHGVVYTENFGKSAYIVKARVQLMRDLGCCQSAHSAFLINNGLETLPLRMEKYCQNAQKVAEFLQAHDKIEFVNYPTLEGNKYQPLAEKYLPNGASGVISVNIKGTRAECATFIDSLKLISLVVHVADIRTCILHPASSTHRQMSDEQLVEAGVATNLVRLSVGLENIQDILEDLTQALENI